MGTSSPRADARTLTLGWLLAFGLAADLALGGLWLLWPGLWQEAVHPWALGTTFDALQAHGALRLARAGLALWAFWGARVAHASATPGADAAVAVLRSRLRWAALGGAWSLEVPAAALRAWQMGDAGPLARGVHVAATLCAVVVAAGAWRRATASLNRRSPDSP